MNRLRKPNAKVFNHVALAEIRAELAKKGTLIGHYDVLIAGHACSRGLILVSNNLREFELYGLNGIYLDLKGIIYCCLHQN